MAECVACKNTIPDGAHICAVCGSYQSVWKNWLQYVSGIAALVGLSASAMVWLYGNARPLIWHKDDVYLVATNSIGSVVVANRGDGEVFVSHVLLTMEGRTSNWSAPRVNIEERLQPGQFLRREVPRDRDDQRKEWVRGLSEVEFEALIARAVRGDKCVELVFLGENDSTLRDLRQMAGSTLNTFKVGGYLQYWGQRSREPKFVGVTGAGAVLRCF